MKLYWMETSLAFPEDTWLETQWACFDDNMSGQGSDSLRDICIGSMHQIQGGPEGRLWWWTVTAIFPGPHFPFITTGTRVSRREAGRSLSECYKGMLEFYGRHRTVTAEEKGRVQF